MYSISLGSAECLVFYEAKGRKKSEFTFNEIKAVVNQLLDRKQRNNGVGTHLLNTLRTSGSCRHDFSRPQHSLGFFCRADNGLYTICLTGEYPHELLSRLNSRGERSLAIAASRNVREERRRLRALNQYHGPAVYKQRALAGQNSSLRLHFKNSILSCADAINIVAYAAKHDVASVRKRFMKSLDERAVAVMKLKGGFVFRLDLLHGYRGLLSMSTCVELRTTNDNTHAAYRRVRNALRKRLHRENKKRVAAAKEYATLRQLTRSTLRLFG